MVVAETQNTSALEELCVCEGDRFVVTITASDEEVTEQGPTMLCCAGHLAVARAVADFLGEREPDMKIKFDVHPVEKA